MSDLFGQALWPGVSSFIEASYVLSWGVAPGVVTLTVPPDLDGIAEVGDLTLTDGVNTVTIPDCKIISPLGQIDASGQRITLSIYDHRWRWQSLGSISGSYNQLLERTATIPPLPNPLALGGANIGNPLLPPIQPVPGEEPIQPWTKKSASELAVLCLEAMGEQTYDVGQMPSDIYPSVDWDAINPAIALEQLAHDFGCVVVYRPDAAAVLIAKQGEGQDLPDGSFLQDQPSFDLKARPSRIQLLTARTRYQQRFYLVPVGKDFDGSYKPINDLSYRPLRGDWSIAAPPVFGPLPADGQLPGGRTRIDALALAQAYVWRAFQIAIDGPGIPDPFLVPPENGAPVFGQKGPFKQITVKRLKQIRLLPVRNNAARDAFGRDAQLPAACFGKHRPPAGGYNLAQTWVGAYEDTDADTQVRIPFTIDDEHQVILFDDYVFGMEEDDDGNLTIIPPMIVLECAFEIRDPDTNQYIRGVRELPLSGGVDSKPATIVREDVRYLVTTEYGPDNAIKKVSDNSAIAGPRADHFLRGEAVRFAVAAADTRTYPGIQPIVPDGQIMQVSWAVGGGRCETRASANSEHAVWLPAYAARQRLALTDLDQQRRDAQDVFANKEEDRRIPTSWRVPPAA